MKIFTTKYIVLASIAAVGILSSCKEDKGGDQPTTGGNLVTIDTEVYTKSNVTLELNDGSTMNVYVKTGGSVDAPDFMPAVKATRGNGGWTTNPEIRLEEGQTICMYAISPYSEANTNPSAIPVNTKEQVDLLYSGDFVPASYQTNRAMFRMKHALALASFNISYSGTGEAGTLTSLSVSGDNVATEGTLNTETGKIKAGASNQVTVNVNKAINPTGWTNELPGQWVIPFDNTSQAASLTATINGKTYVATMPSVEMRSGFQYIFHLILTPNGLVFDPSATEEISLNVFSDEMKPTESYGAITFGFSGTEFQYPFFDGTQVFGNIKSGSTSTNYTVGGSLTISGSGTRNVIVETWNSTGFELNSLDGIESIDISGY
ncbi:MAG: fimbrillin family protein [Muribaculaceae bacterium]|nr:fimbrillin family protein [Muribaculaceae bacterium]